MAQTLKLILIDEDEIQDLLVGVTDENGDQNYEHQLLNLVLEAS